MKLNTKVRYGLRAVTQIASSTEVLLQKDIADKQKIPLKYLDTIITGLRAKGLIKNFNGKKSGYVLAKLPSEIKIYDVYRAFEPEIAIVDCLCEPNICEITENCEVRDFWANINSQFRQALSNTTIKDILDKNFQT